MASGQGTGPATLAEATLAILDAFDGARVVRCPKGLAEAVVELALEREGAA